MTMHPPSCEWALRLAVSASMPWRYAPGGREAGHVDCYGYVRALLSGFGVDLPAFDGVAGGDWAGVFEAQWPGLAEEVAEADSRCGDVVFYGHGGRHHIGVVLGGGQFAHCEEDAGVLVSRLPKRGSRLRPRFFRLKEGGANG